MHSKLDGHRWFARVSDSILHAYGKWVPYHRGKWRIVGKLRGFTEPTWNEVRVTTIKGVKYRLDLRDSVAVRLYYEGLYEPNESRFVVRQLKPGMVACDIGANVGYFSLLMGRLVGPSGRVFSFEPGGRAFRELEYNISLNDLRCISSHRLAISDREGNVELVEPRECTTMNYIQEVVSGNSVVQATSLDMFFEGINLDRLDLVKMDIEGAELKALRGAQHIIRKFRPIILLEVNPGALARMGCSADELVSLLEEDGYELRKLTTSGRTKQLTSMPAANDFTNIAALPKGSG